MSANTMEIEESLFGATSLSQGLGDDAYCTEDLVKLATDIADATVDVVLKEKNNAKVSMGKLLQAVLQFASTESQPDGMTGLRYIAIIICTADKDNTLQATAEIILNYMLYPMKAFQSIRTPPSSSDDQTPDLDDVAQQVEPPAKRQASFRKQLLIREDYRCAVHRHELDKEYRLLAQKGDKSIYTLRACHIVPFCLNSFSKEKIKSPAITWTLIKSWTGCDLQSLIGDGINDISNGILLCPNMQGAFSDFTVYFTATDGRPNTYRLYSSSDDDFLQFVEFIPRQTMPVPSPKLLSIHAAFARALYNSGAADYFDEIETDLDETRTLAQDGSSHDALYYALQSLAV